MSGRGARIVISFIAFLVLRAQFCFAAPDLEIIVPVYQSRTLERLCQNPQKIDYGSYFTKPEREGSIVYVFYNVFIDNRDNQQFGYALLYGLEFASENAKPGDKIAVGIYFSNDRGKIYLIEKKTFDEFHGQKLSAEALLKYLTVKEVDVKKSSVKR